MRFHELTHPRYETDQTYDAANPIRFVPDIWLPGVICDECGEIWTGSRRIYLPISDPSLRRRLSGIRFPVPLEKWRKLAQEVRAAISLPDDFPLEPGDVLGTPRAKVLSREIPDFLHRFPGQLIVRTKVVEALERAKLTGFQPVRVQTYWSEQLHHFQMEPPSLFELVVTGVAWRVDSDLKRLTACQHCGRLIFPDPDWLVVDESRWDGSDFFHVDRNPNIALVTERVCEVLAEHDFTNYACLPVGSES